MVKNRRWPLDRTFAALADPTRRAILARLGAGETSVTDLARPFHVSLPAISRHLRVLEHAGLIERRRDGRSRRCRLLAQPMREAADWIDRKSTRLNSSHLVISYAVFCLKKKISKPM